MKAVKRAAVNCTSITDNNSIITLWIVAGCVPQTESRAGDGSGMQVHPIRGKDVGGILSLFPSAFAYGAILYNSAFER
jgi:hypothetical protein